MKAFSPFMFFMVLAATPCVAETSGSGISITEAWSRATPPLASTGVVYLTIADSGAPDSLIAVSTPVAATAKVHESKTVDGVMQMRAIDRVPVSSKAPTRLIPDGYHVMMEGLKQPLKAGDRFPLTLTFEHAGPVTATVTVTPLGASMPAGDSMGGMKMDSMR